MNKTCEDCYKQKKEEGGNLDKLHNTKLRKKSEKDKNGDKLGRGLVK